MVTQAKTEAKEFISEIKRLVKAQDNVIYHIDSSIGKRNAWIEITLFNVTNPDELFSAHEWVHIGSLGGDIDTYSGNYRNDYNPSIEIHKRL